MVTPMSNLSADKQIQIAAHAQAIAALLYEETPREDIQTLADIETVVRDHVLEHVSPILAIFLSKPVVAPAKAAPAPSTAWLEN